MVKTVLLRRLTEIIVNVEVDEHCPARDQVRVYIKGSTIHDAKIIQPNGDTNNNEVS